MNALTPAEQALGIPLPNRLMEDWRWTDLRQRITKPYPKAQVEAPAKEVDRLLASSPFAKLAKARLVFVNGKFDEKRSTDLGNVVIQHSASLNTGSELGRLNVRLEGTGRTIQITDSADTLIEIVHIATAAEPRAMALHNSIHVGKGAMGTVVETFLGDGDYILNSITEIVVNVGGRLDHLKYQNDSNVAVHLSETEWSLAERAQLNSLTVQQGSSLVRQNGNCHFNGEHANARISGAYLLTGKQHCDTALKVNHNVPNCTSRELFKCVMDGYARGIFQGKVYVAKDAQKTDGKQSSHALLLSDAAEFDAKPELEIYADDVVCGHGTTSGDLNHDHLFYLKSRGIPEAEARALLVAAFVGEAIETVEHEELRDALKALVES